MQAWIWAWTTQAGSTPDTRHSHSRQPPSSSLHGPDSTCCHTSSFWSGFPQPRLNAGEGGRQSSEQRELPTLTSAERKTRNGNEQDHPRRRREPGSNPPPSLGIFSMLGIPGQVPILLWASDAPLEKLDRGSSAYSSWDPWHTRQGRRTRPGHLDHRSVNNCAHSLRMLNMNFSHVTGTFVGSELHIHLSQLCLR